MIKIRRILAGAAVAAVAVTATALPAQAAYYDSRYECHAVGSTGSWRAFGYDNRGNHDYTGPKRFFKVSATNDCIDWLSVT